MNERRPIEPSGPAPGQRSATATTSRAPVAAIFDLDGVITFTARVHRAAWKELFDAFLRAHATRTGEPFRPFETEDYLAYVDGLPRYEGVKRFLESRGISLPYGDPSDPPDRETVCGLGNRKNELFRARLAADGVDVDAGAIRLVRDLRAAGVRCGLASSSRNAGLILERAGLAGLFDASVDGAVSERLGLRGKPNPDIFLACLERLVPGADPGDALLVEDAAAGIAAGRAGGFGVVVGVDRGGQWLTLRERGADWITTDMEAITLEAVFDYFAGKAHARPNVLGQWRVFEAELGGRTPAVFLDYDGTLTPIVDRPELARLDDGMRETLRHLARNRTVVIVTGRGLDDVRALVGAEALIYAASHGFDVAGPPSSGLRYEADPDAPPRVRAAYEAVRPRLAAIPGAFVENKKFSLAVHYRLVPEDRVPDVERIVDDVLAASPGLRKTGGKKVFELRPAMDWDKGRAVLWLLETLGLDRPDVVPLYVGDDETDEDAFRALAGRGIGVVVTETPRPTAARYSLQNVAEVKMLLDRLAGAG